MRVRVRVRVRVRLLSGPGCDAGDAVSCATVSCGGAPG